MAISSAASPDDKAPADSRPVQRGEPQLRPAGVTLSWLSLTQLHLDRQGHTRSSVQHESTDTRHTWERHPCAERGNDEVAFTIKHLKAH
ncbi:hypothetical protein PBY51_005391 [Eleginops maclovinus]|uniref:Uncharacterized protein n=1 Tax=Eleginops maclovinus TaxID=56733 RepID=A0AAN7X690_ELEMC|nr:hypothetical protein PBY51_005391 [Eleginops maclovinus]